MKRYYTNIYGNKIEYELNGDHAPLKPRRSTKTHREIKIQAEWKGGNQVEIKTYNKDTEKYESFTCLTIGTCESNHAKQTEWEEFLDKEWSNKDDLDWILGV